MDPDEKAMLQAIDAKQDKILAKLDGHIAGQHVDRLALESRITRLETYGGIFMILVGIIDTVLAIAALARTFIK